MEPGLPRQHWMIRIPIIQRIQLHSFVLYIARVHRLEGARAFSHFSIERFMEFH